jgi:hypothetical protein
MIETKRQHRSIPLNPPGFPEGPFMFHRFALKLSCLLVALGCTSGRADDPESGVADGKRLLKEGNELADQGQTTDAVLRYKQAFERLLPAMRKLPFRHEVRRDVTEREKLKDVLLAEFEADMTPEQFRASEQGMKALGFVPRDLDLKAVLVKVYSEEIAAFYDPRTKTMHLIKEPETKKGPSFLERLLGKTGGFDKEENQTVIAHELTHALADQHYDLKAMQDAVKDDDDQDLALSALIEGEATLTMMGAQMDDWEGKAISRLPAEDLDRTFSILGSFLPMMGGQSLRSSPAILRESMMFPYIRGLVFCAKLTNDGDWKAIDDAYRRPPLSTEQILHPEKYAARPDPPTAIHLGTLDVGDGWKELGRNVVGEFQLATLLRRHGGRKAAAGWDGDRFAVFEGPEGRLGLVWQTTWDTEDDAREFARSYARFQTGKLGEGAEQPDEMRDHLSRDHDGACFAIERRGADVAVVEGFPADDTSRLLEAAFAARKSEKLPPAPKPPAEASGDAGRPESR